MLSPASPFLHIQGTQPNLPHSTELLMKTAQPPWRPQSEIFTIPFSGVWYGQDFLNSRGQEVFF